MKKILVGILLSIIVITLITLGVLGSIERKGYLEVVGKSYIRENEYQVRFRYYSKIFRNNDIYGVYSKDIKLPSYVDGLEFESNGSPFAKMYTKKDDLKDGSTLVDNVPYKLKIRTTIYLYLIFIMSLAFVLYQLKRALKLNIFYSSNEILEGLSKVNTNKNVFYIVGIAFISFIFLCFWYNKFYYSDFHTDPIVEAIGRIIDFRFPEFFFSKTSQSDSSYWYNTRWTGAVYTYLFYQTIPKIYTFFGGDVVKSIFVTQGILASFIYTSTAFILALYIKEVFKVKLLSKHFLLFLFLTNVLPVVINSIILGSNLSFFMGLSYGLSQIANYNGSILVLLIALYIYWRYFLNNKWEDWYNKNILKVFYYLVIILTAFSGPAITAFYFSISFFILFIMAVKNKSIKKIFNNKIIPTLFTSIFLSFIALLLEKKIVGGRIDLTFSDRIASFGESSIIVIIYAITFFIISFLPVMLSIYFTQKKHGGRLTTAIRENSLNKNIFLALIFCFISMIVFFALPTALNTQTIEQMFKTGYGAMFNSAYITIANIFLTLSITIMISTLIIYLSSAFIKSVILMFLISHFIFFISYVPNSNHSNDYKFYNALREANKLKNEENIIYLDEDVYYYYYVSYMPKTYGINVAAELARQLDIIDRNAIIKLKQGNEGRIE